eukprot:3809118-Alexandrium_andersonii.AAC.1
MGQRLRAFVAALERLPSYARGSVSIPCPPEVIACVSRCWGSQIHCWHDNPRCAQCHPDPSIPTFARLPLCRGVRANACTHADVIAQAVAPQTCRFRSAFWWDPPHLGALFATMARILDKT